MRDKTIRVLAALLFWLAVWAFAAWRVNAEFLLPGPRKVAETLAALGATASFWQTILASLLRIFAGMLLGTLLGALLAVLTTAWDWADAILTPAIRVIRAIPVASFSLLVLLWVYTNRVPVVVSALMVLPVVWGNVSQGIRQTDPLLLEAAKVYRFGRWKTVKLVYIPSVLPYFASGCHTALGLAWKAGVAAEVLCIPKQAIGTQVYYSKYYLETPELFAWTLVVLALSFLMERGLAALLLRLKGGDKG
ncbi:ABC transporter permease [Pseudoflavonifractor phocaeensis]|uniref:ABC transporter permease n=1 Tax=Pseudoflavonifractor phocaeensis TaxID=1870988 RepID=UPI00195B6A11|nr:ABC transporter permease subunit [Pseudoflavonifractor phocaeensis]MBM6869362.1 ABC transporter permease subunit [Pseudoflavonifractor phocaeensis]